jgi:hypothetical protein
MSDKDKLVRVTFIREHEEPIDRLKSKIYRIGYQGQISARLARKLDAEGKIRLLDEDKRGNPAPAEA